MTIMPVEAPQDGGGERFYTPATRRNWRVSMEVRGLLWWPTWTGEANDSEHAKARAERAFVARWGAGLPLRVVAVIEIYQGRAS